MTGKNWINYYAVKSAATSEEVGVAWRDSQSGSTETTYWLGTSVHDISWKKTVLDIFSGFLIWNNMSEKLFPLVLAVKLLYYLYYCYYLENEANRDHFATCTSYILTSKSAVSELYVVDKSHIKEQNKDSVNISLRGSAVTGFGID